ncbi:T9SS type B sorting domain-containing protein [Dyadobacter luticola]|uniref:Gliding motility-associated C-terminal domain-containing protein n=1 Tax=Dyadobacter luticola TaxID=1979387 RepID=A0A5R9KV73_9BACT|nr:gliding motility-associated C-terminal domain-containing protein [Dyadobacter luticola]TLV00131.1 gliding motility-associated C-terminal domain-containing protein [Dyadobacter luticola]
MKLKLPILLFIVLFKLLPEKAFAQGLCDRGGGSFDVDFTEGCAPLTVRITNTLNNALSVAYAAAYDGRSTNPAIQDVASVTYRNRGVYTLFQQAVTSAGVVYACKVITVYESRPVSATYASCGGGKITLILAEDLVIPGYDQVLIEWGDGQTSLYKSGDSFVFDHNYTDVSSSPTVKITGQHIGKSCTQGAVNSLPISFQQSQLNDISIKSIEMLGSGTLRVNYLGVTAIPTEIQYRSNGGTYATAGRRSSGGLQPFDIVSLNVNQAYQVQLSYQDLCQGVSQSRAYSSMSLSGKSENGANVLTWSQYPEAADFEGYDLMRDGVLIKSFSSVSEVTFTDPDVQCGSYSEYQIIAKINGITSTSAPVGVKTEVSTAKPLEKASVSVSGENLVVIKASVPGAGPNSTYDLSIEKAEAGSTTFKKIITLYNQSEYSDPDVKTSEMSYCYRLSYQNSCGQKLPVSQPMCTILLKKELTNLVWTPESPLLAGVTNYNVIQLGSGGAENIPVQLKTVYTIKLNAQSDLQYNFQVRAESADSTFESLSNIINYKRSAGVFMPDAFSPNGDGYNDLLEAKSDQLQSFNLSILNRWGQVVFYSDDITKSWDGTINGSNAPVGSYVYKMTFVDDINQTVEKNGTFMLLR